MWASRNGPARPRSDATVPRLRDRLAGAAGELLAYVLAHLPLCRHMLQRLGHVLAEELFGWGKAIGGLVRLMLRGVARLRFKFTLTMAAYDLIRLPKLLVAPALHHQPTHTFASDVNVSRARSPMGQYERKCPEALYCGQPRLVSR
jgi:hypothetical protein